MAASNVAVPYDRVNPYCFEPEISPHIAADEAKISIDLVRIRRDFEALAKGADCVLVEGAGGWLAPLGPRLSIQDLALALRLPVVVVVGLRLGCINHALLTKLGVESNGAQFAGWVANIIDPTMARLEENLETLTRLLEEPPLAVVPYRVPDAPPLALPGAIERLLAKRER
jgi:dethiobiotin synthetase